jgi:hypothetical protein
MSLNVAHNLFGVTFGVGVRNRAPRKGGAASDHASWRCGEYDRFYAKQRI